MPSFITSAAVVVLAAAPAVYAHGHVAYVKSGGQTYTGAPNNWQYETNLQSAGWRADNLDNGFVSPDAYDSADIICHKSATPGNTYIPVKAGSEIEVMWDTWPESHKGPVTNYLARCNGDCTKISASKKEKLNFFAIQTEGLLNAANNNWATDELIANNFTATVKIPSNLSGNFVLRHEIIALHAAGQANGAQSYPQCINLKVTGGAGNAHPCNEGADCRKGTALYKSSDAGINFNLYTTLSSYPIPGPKVFSGLKKRMAAVAQAFRA